MDMLHQLYTMVLVQPVYNLVIWLYATIAQESAAVTMIMIGLTSAAVFMPTMIRNYFDQEQVKTLQPEIATIQSQATDPQLQQQKILQFLKSKNIHFKSESVYLFGQAVVLALLYPVLLQYWHIDGSYLYSFVPQPDSLSSDFFTLQVTRSSPTFSLLPAVLLFFELRLSYQQQSFLTGFVDRWYPVILPLFTYFLIFWMPSGLALVLATSLAVSLYVKYMLQFFTSLRRRQSMGRA